MRRGWLLVIVPFATVVLLTGFGLSARAAYPGGNGLIAWEHNGNDTSVFEIYVMRPDGSDQTRLTFSAGSADPAWSPDGTKIAFSRNSGNGGEIWVMNADGSNQTQLTVAPGADDITPTWSSDGSKIAFARYTSNWDIWVMNADGTGQTDVTNNRAEDVDPSWQPGGSKIAFRTSRDLGNPQIYTMNADGSAITNLSNDPTNFDEEPDWSPDGSKILFESSRATPTYGVDIYVMNADGSGVTRLTTTTQDTMPAWSPDGKKIVFASSREFNYEIFVMNADGSHVTRLTTGPEDWFPNWQPTAAPTEGTLTVVKHLVPANDPGRFNLLIGGTNYATNVGNNGTTGSVTLTPGTHGVSETAGTRTTLDKIHYASTISCSNGTTGVGTSVQVRVDGGDDITCTITNTRKLRKT